jgi:phage protein D
LSHKQIELDADTKKLGLFSIAPEKGSVTAGASLPVVFTYKLPTTAAAATATATKRASPSTTATRASVDNSSSAANSSWTSYTATVKLKGGAKSEGQPDVSTVTVVLRVPCAKN